MSLWMAPHTLQLKNMETEKQHDKKVVNEGKLASYRRTQATLGTGIEKTKDWKELKKQRKAWKEMKVIEKLEKAKKLKDEEVKQRQKEEEQARTQAEIGRHFTVSIALPGSILDNAQSPELRTYLAGQIARAAVIFNVDEIVIYDEDAGPESGRARSVEGEFSGVKKHGEASVQLGRILQYLECPQYLRKHFFPQHRDLQYAGLLNPLDCPHHMRANEESDYREGVVVSRPVKPGRGSFVHVGLVKEVQVDRLLQAGLRVTVELDKTQTTETRASRGRVVSPATPRLVRGLYWGYGVRLASGLGTALTESPHAGGYDLVVGTSDQGDPVAAATLPRGFRHMMVVFGGVKGIEAAIEADDKLPVSDPEDLFQLYLNTCAGQGSRTIRTEEAILISMAALQPKVTAAQSMVT
ncbi:PREDICTED: putative methyltransferase C9orf114 [Priapulus caudatus]|uniref:Methyltransferase C9orf114 n=1 Tax=Priapulus caudatus TaxID=37621 RepID=A0ABM1EP48_PRICU|nr:PREDICTED: putative methyltransferase C9orf114 [Priapulus caudatus]